MAGRGAYRAGLDLRPAGGAQHGRSLQAAGGGACNAQETPNVRNDEHKKGSAQNC